jgi:hypothetical protein
LRSLKTAAVVPASAGMQGDGGLLRGS